MLRIWAGSDRDASTFKMGARTCVCINAQRQVADRSLLRSVDPSYPSDAIRMQVQ
eukprot:m.1142389 g.1142389  ORF g.1142389 m.1142389 type:complete len:55 (-) comp24454_c0_seq3:757-921(-)